MDTTPQVKASRVELRLVVDMISQALIATLAAPERDTATADSRHITCQKTGQDSDGA
jgi:hypothetical protein